MQTYTVPVQTTKTIQGIFVRSNGQAYFICLEDNGYDVGVKKATLYQHVASSQTWMKLRTKNYLYGTFTDDSLLKLFFDPATAHITTSQNGIIL